MRFVTRKNAAVDRIACPWLIRRHIDHDAEFLYVEPQDVGRVAKEKDAIPFDVEGARLGHHGGIDARPLGPLRIELNHAAAAERSAGDGQHVHSNEVGGHREPLGAFLDQALERGG